MTCDMCNVACDILHINFVIVLFLVLVLQYNSDLGANANLDWFQTSIKAIFCSIDA